MRRFPMLGWAAVLVVLLICLAPAWAGEMNGKVMSVDPDRQELVVQMQGQPMTLQMDEDAQVTIDGKQATLADLRAGDEVTIIHREERGTMMAIEVRCRRGK
jgi:hypothetical protein